MRRALAVASLCGFILAGAGCNRVQGEKYADKINEIVVARIKSGKIKSAEDIKAQNDEVVREALKEMGFNPDTARFTQSEQEKFKKKLDVYKEEWGKLLAAQSPK